jgi:asparagine synthase (glutamine-hydrolysing)
MHQAGVIVSIEGQGADEIISGYTNLLPYYFADLLAEGKWLQFMKRSVQHKAALSNPFKSALKLLIDKSIGSVRLHDPAKYASFDADFYPVNNAPKIAEGGRGYLNAELRQQLSHTSLPEQLIKADKSAMHFSIESRFPFLDYRLVEFAATLPFSYKIQDKSKYILREALRDVLPPVVYERRDKIGFAVPVHKMLSDELFNSLTQRLLESKFPGFDASRFYKEFSAKERINWRYWKVVSLILWNQAFESFNSNHKLDLTVKS